MAKKKRKRRGRRSRNNPLSRGKKIAIGVLATAVTASVGYGIYNRVAGKNKIRGCGEKYRHLVVTASGYTLENPYGAVAFGSDYEEWREQAREWSVKANRIFADLGELECEKTGGLLCESETFAQGGQYPKWSALLDLNNRMTESYQALPNAYVTNPVVGIGASQKVIADALCLIDRAEQAIRFYGGTVTDMPTVTPEEAPGFLGRIFPSLNFKIPWYAWAGLATVGFASGAAIAYGVRNRVKKLSNPFSFDLDEDLFASAYGDDIMGNPDEAAA
jgi:hypothetical protein